MLRRRDRGEAGFTLIELVIAISILAIISAALIGVLLGYVRNASETNTRETASSDQQFVAAYWQTDVSSLGVWNAPSGGSVSKAQSVWVSGAPGSTFTAPGTLPGTCAGHANAVVAMQWNDYQTVPTDNPTGAWSPTSAEAVVYYTKSSTNSNGTSQTQLWRDRCGDQSSDIIVARYLTTTPSVGCAASDGTTMSCTSSTAFPATVAITLTVDDLSQGVLDSTGYTTTLTAQRRQG